MYIDFFPVQKKILLIFSVFLLIFISKVSYSTELTALITKLFQDDHSISNAERSVKEAKNDVSSAWTAYLPELIADFIRGTERKYKYEAANDMYDHQEFDLTLKQKIYDFGETGSDIKQKKNALDTSSIDLQAAKMTLIIDSVDAYLGYIDAVKKLDSEKEALASKIESTGQEESRVKKGSGMPSDVLQAKADLAGAQKTKIKAEGDLRKAINKYFKTFKSEPPRDIDGMNLIELSNIGESQLPGSIDAALEIALVNNVDLLKKEIDFRDAELDFFIARADFLPGLDFESTYKNKYNVSGTLGNTQEVNWKITLSVPLQPWQSMPDYKSKKLALLTAQTDLDEEEYALIQSISDLWEDYQVALLTRDFAVNKVVISEELLSIKKKERQLDQADAAAVTAAENALNDDKKALIDDETALTESSLDLLEAMGVLSLDSIQDVLQVVETNTKTSSDNSNTETETEVAQEEEVVQEEEEGAAPEAAPVDPVEESTVASDESTNTEMLQELNDALEESNTEEAESNGEATEEASQGGCPSNTFVGEKQADGSWKTVCKG